MSPIRPLPPVISCARGAKGAHVKRIQEWLTLRGYGVALDGDFGPATERALAMFCAAGAAASWNGVADEIVVNALERPMLDAVADVRPVPDDLRSAVCDVAAQHLREHPREVGGQNRGPWVRLYMDGREGKDWKWCAGFVWYVLAQAAKQLGVPMPLKPSYSCSTFVERNRGGRFLPGESPQLVRRGDVFFVRRAGDDAGYQHTGIVVDVQPDHVVTIEGNTNDEGSREGYEVCRRVRAYGRLDFLSIAG